MTVIRELFLCLPVWESDVDNFDIAIKRNGKGLWLMKSLVNRRELIGSVVGPDIEGGRRQIEVKTPDELRTWLAWLNGGPVSE